MIARKRDIWYQSADCTVNEIIDYIEKKNQMRDAQIEAIKTYLFLKVSCENKPLYKLFSDGAFNTIQLDELELSTTTREFLNIHPEAVALYEYANLTNDEGGQVSEKIAKAIKSDPYNINYYEVFKNIFYGVTYSDYLFSLPMGAGKTYLMAAFIYLDLYFALNEPDNKAFAHNFIIFAPSGLKTSVVPSLKTIQNFDPSWILAEPAASEIKRMIKFEILDQTKAAKKSNKTRNPNVQKIAIHQPLHELIGLVAVTNAEKVILDRIKEQKGQISFLEESDVEKDKAAKAAKAANELRNLIGKLPNLSIFIDEVHHAVSEEIKLRAVVEKWTREGTINSIIGFSGTPYLDSPEKIKINNELTVASIEISNTVFYYPLVNGVGNFLKRPIVKISNNPVSLEIIEEGLRLFLDKYKDKEYEGSLKAKIGIYCSSIEKLETMVYPLVEKISKQYSLNPDIILKFHGGNKQFPMPADSQMEFDSLDKPISKKRIVLLCQIGKEGWDCKSLTGIILSQEGDSPIKMVLQTSCRCLRQVEKGTPETALIYLNEGNGEILNKQLRQQHHISIQEFENAHSENNTQIKRYDRTAYLKLPKIDFYQLKINYKTLIIDNELDIEENIKKAITEKTEKGKTVIKTSNDFKQNISEIKTIFDERGKEIANFNIWLYKIVKESFAFISMSMLMQYEDALGDLFKIITYEKDGIRYFSSYYNLELINANIRKAFYEKRSFESFEELIPYEASLLNITNFTDMVYTSNPKDYYPDIQMTENIIKADKGKLKPDKKMEQLIKLAEETGQNEFANNLKQQCKAHEMKDKSFHYIPYRTDSYLEQIFLEEILANTFVKDRGLEVYYNGDRALTEFKIKCFKRALSKWQYIGIYTPDFLIIERKNNKIYKAIIVETKGKIYANDPTFKDKKSFMHLEFVRQNNEQYGYNRFEYLYLEDDLKEDKRITKTANAIEKFFGEV